MAGPIVTGNFPSDLNPVVKRYFGMAYKEHPELFKRVFTEESSDQAYEEYSSFAGLGTAILKDEGSGITYDSGRELFSHRLRPLTYGLGFKITREAIEDQKVLKFVTRKAVELKKACLENKEIRAFNILNRAFNSSYTGADGIELIASNHPTLSSTFANELSTPADLAESSLEQAVIDMRNSKDNRGIRMMISPTQLIIPSALEFEACRILKGMERPGTADRDINALKYKDYLQVDPIISPYLTDDDAWFLKTDVKDGLIYINRRSMEIERDNDFDTENAKFKATFRDVFGWNDPRGIFGSEGAA